MIGSIEFEIAPCLGKNGIELWDTQVIELGILGSNRQYISNKKQRVKYRVNPVDSIFCAHLCNPKILSIYVWIDDGSATFQASYDDEGRLGSVTGEINWVKIHIFNNDFVWVKEDSSQPKN